jgi:hypothetical protein
LLLQRLFVSQVHPATVAAKGEGGHVSKRHWLMDEIDFVEEPHDGGPYEKCVGGCPNCNRAAQGIADSIALYGCDLDTADAMVSLEFLDTCARRNVDGWSEW